MDERYDVLATPPGDAFADRLEALLLRRLREGSAAGGALAAERSDEIVEIGVVTGDRYRWSRRGSRRWFTVGAAAVATALIGAGLVLRSRAGEPAAVEALPSRNAALAALGAPRPATGPPVVMGFLADDEEADVITSTEAAQAAANYVNDHLGGIAGRPLELRICSTGDATDDRAGRACGRSFTQQGVVAVLQGRSVWGEVVNSEASVAGIPFVAFDVVDLAARAAGAFQLVSQDAAGVGPARLAADAGRRRAGVVTTTGSPEAGYVPAAQRPYYERGGVVPTFASVAADGTDADAVARTLVSAAVEQVHLLTNDPTCAPVLAALRRAGFRGPVYVNRGCLDSSGLDVDLSGVARVGAYPSDPDGREAALFREVLAAYTGGGTVGRFAPSGYGAVMGVARALGALAGDVTAASVRSSIEQMAPAALPIVDGVTFRCGAGDGRVPSSDCSRTVTVVELEASGATRRRHIVDMDALLTS